MQTFQLHHHDRNVLFEGDYRTLRECIEDALRGGIDLSQVNLAYADLSEINLDGARLSGVNFSHANLTGANISEAVLHDCDFKGAALFNACLCHSDLSGSDFSDASFGGTDIAGALLAGCSFSGLSALDCDFMASRGLDGAIFRTPWKSSAMSRPLLVIKGLPANLAVFDEDILIGCDIYQYDRSVWTPRQASNQAVPDVDLLRFASQLMQLRCNSPKGCIAMQKSTER